MSSTSHLDHLAPTAASDFGPPTTAGSGAATRFVVPPPVELVDASRGAVAVRRLNYTSGSAVPAVFVHGLGGSSTNWLELMGGLPPQVASVALDLPGFGFSPPPADGDYSMATQTQVVAEIVEGQFSGRPVHLFGNSMGGAIAVRLAAARPDLIESLTLVAPAMPERRLRASNIHLPLTAVPRIGEPLMQRVLAKPAEWRVEQSMRMIFGDPGRVSEERIAMMIEEADYRATLPYATEAVLASLRSLLSTYLDRSAASPWKLAANIPAPVLGIYGQRDRLVHASAADRITREFSNARVLVIPAAGHVPQMEYPELVATSWSDMVRLGVS